MLRAIIAALTIAITVGAVMAYEPKSPTPTTTDTRDPWKEVKDQTVYVRDAGFWPREDDTTIYQYDIVIITRFKKRPSVYYCQGFLPNGMLRLERMHENGGWVSWSINRECIRSITYED